VHLLLPSWLGPDKRIQAGTNTYPPTVRDAMADRLITEFRSACLRARDETVLPGSHRLERIIHAGRNTRRGLLDHPV
jgi:hypothetical protein